MSSLIEIAPQLEVLPPNNITATFTNEDLKSSNGLAAHISSALTTSEMAAERRFVRKIDLMILPLLVFSVFLASLDRGDMGYASNSGMNDELAISSSEYSIVVSMFYVGYFVMSFPATLFLKKIRGNTQLAFALLFWGLFTTLMSTATSYRDLAVYRLLIGAGEALNQAAGLYLTFFYKREQLASRGAFYFGVYALAGSMNGILAYGIFKNLDGKSGWRAWKWLFVIEVGASGGYGFDNVESIIGSMSMFWGVVMFFLLPASPEKLSRVFTAQEKEIAKRRYREAYNVEGDPKIRGSHVLKVLKDPHSWLYCALYSSTNISLTGLGNFLPQLIKSFGFTTLTTDLLTIPVWFVTAVAVLSLGFLSDRLRRRGVLMMACYALAAIGYAILLARPTAWAQYAATFFIGAGTYPTVVLVQSCATLTALLFMTGQVFSIAPSYSYYSPPYYTGGNAFALLMMGAGFVLTGLQIRVLSARNQAKIAASGSADEEAKRRLGVEEIGDEHPDFEYFL